MDDSLFARLGNDPMRIHAHFYGQPNPGGIARFNPASARVEVKGEGAAPLPEEPPPGTEDVPQDAPPPAHSERDGTAQGHGGEGSPPEAGPDDAPDLPQDGEDGNAPDLSPQMHDWLTRNWATIEALDAAGKLPDLAPLETKPADADQPEPEPEPEPEPAAAAEPDPPAEPPRVRVAPGDRWTKKKMTDFLRQLAATHSVTAAARSVGMSRESAHRLRNRLKGQPFDIAWEAAFRHGYDNLAHAALELALEGQEVRHYHRGELIDTYRKPVPQLMVQLLNMRNRVGAPMLGRYGAAAEYWGENWDTLLQRVENGAVDWSDERAALGEDGLKRLDVPDNERELKLIELRNLPDDGPPKRRP